jgi:inhibitor of cysteine peptidase
MSFKSMMLAIACALLVAAPALAIESANGTVFTSSPVAVKVNQDFLIALPSNPTTGYSWTAKTTGSAVAVEGSAYQPSAATGKPMMGAGGQQIFIVQSLKPGTATIAFSYARPWQKGVKAARTMTFAVTVTR